MYLNVGTISALVEVSHGYKLVVYLKELYEVTISVPSIFSDGDVQALVPTIFRKKILWSPLWLTQTYIKLTQLYLKVVF